VDVGAPLAADSQAAERVKPRDRALDHPAPHAQSAAVPMAPLGQEWTDAQVSQPAAKRSAVVGAVTHKAARTPAGPAHFACDRRNRFDETPPWHRVMGVCASQKHGEGHSTAVGDEVVFASGPCAVDGIGPRFSPPPTARIEKESTAVRDQSIRSAARGRSSSTWWIR
jgi:hypothetical protein